MVSATHHSCLDSGLKQDVGKSWQLRAEPGDPEKKMEMAVGLHTLRKEDTAVEKKALEWNPQRTRTRGRPWGTWSLGEEPSTKRPQQSEEPENS